MLTGFKRDLREACERKIEKRVKAEEAALVTQSQSQNAIVFTFTQPMRPRPAGTLQPKHRPVDELAGLLKLKYESWQQEAFSRFFRRDASRIDSVVREVHATFACDWFYIENLYLILKKYNMMPRTTLPLITCEYPVLQATLPETPWGFYFPYFDTSTFDHGYMLYRLSPRFQLVLQSFQ